MRLPPHYVQGNVCWMRDGSVWAVWNVTPASYPLMSEAEKTDFQWGVRTGLVGLPEESLLFSVCAPLTPDAVVAAMATSADPYEHPAWGDTLDVSRAALDGTQTWERRFYLAVALPRPSVADDLRHRVTAGVEALSHHPVPRPSPEDRRKRRQQAEDAANRIGLHMRPCDAGEIRWLYARAYRRGIVDVPLDATWNAPMVERPMLEAVDGAVVHEGGDRKDRGRPKLHRYLRIETEAGTGYQALLALAEMPHRFTFPGPQSEWLLKADQMPYPVDWAARVGTVSNAIARMKARTKAKQMSAQFEEQEDEIERAGIPPELEEAVQDLQDQRQSLQDNPSDPELIVTTIYAVYDSNLAEVERRAATLSETLSRNQFGLARPSGGQWGLFAAMLPGSRESQVVRDYRQHLLPDDLAMGAPFASSDVGDATGLLWGDNASAGTLRPVLWNPAAGFEAGGGGSVAFVGALGSGKSASMKLGMAGVIAQGGQGIVFDRTSTGEWRRFARCLPCVVSDVLLTADAPLSIDPCRVLVPSDGDDEEWAKTVRGLAQTYALGFCAVVTGCDPRGMEGIALSEAVSAVFATPAPSMPAVLALLQAKGERDMDASNAARKLEAFARSPLGGLVFDLSRPPMNLHADFIAMSSPDLRFPTRDQLAHPDRMMPDQVQAQAIMHLVGGVEHAFTIADPGRLAVSLKDEGWSWTGWPEGEAAVLLLMRDGRKRHAAVWFGSPHPVDVGALASFITTWFVFGLVDGGKDMLGDAVGPALAVLGMDDTRANRMLLSHEIMRSEDPDKDPAPAEVIMRDLRGRRGRVHIYPPLTAELALAIETNPLRLARLETARVETNGHLVRSGER